MDGQDSRFLSANELRQYFGVVPLETVLFATTVYDNLLMANPISSFEQIVQACRVAEIHDVIEKLTKGYQTELDERGVGLSTGQKQRIAIARALLKHPRILIFDEATSSLHQATAEHFCGTINEIKGQITIVFVTHAVPKTLQVDEIVRIGVCSRRRGFKARGGVVMNTRNHSGMRWVFGRLTRYARSARIWRSVGDL